MAFQVVYRRRRGPNQSRILMADSKTGTGRAVWWEWESEQRTMRVVVVGRGVGKLPTFV